MESCVLTAENLTKHYRRICALDGVSVRVRRGQITAVVGDNGSGKSTLIKILSGTIRPDSGRIRTDGGEYSELTVAKAQELGIRTVYQDLSLDNSKNAAENIFLGDERLKGIFLDRKGMRQEAEKLLAGIHVRVPDLTEPVRNLSGGQRQGIAIARALRKPGKLLLLDEPTAAMGIQESHSMLELLRSLRERGLTQLMISHNLHQVFAVADYVYVMRAGKILLETETSGTTPEELQEAILVREEAAQ